MGLKFLQITDIHLTGSGDSRLYNIPIADVLKEIVQAVKKIEKSLDFLILTGDLTDTGEEHLYLILDDILSVLSIPCYWLPGNHDSVETMDRLAGLVSIRSEKSFSRGKHHFILLNSVAKDGARGNRTRGLLSGEELLFLDAELRQNQGKICIIALHHPPVFSGTWKDDKMLINYSDFFGVIDRYQNVRLVVYGHQHQTFNATRNNVLFYSPPAASFQFDKEVRWGFEDSPPGYGIIEIGDSGDVECTDIRIDFKIRPVYNK